jgi:hypothetical protein
MEETRETQPRRRRGSLIGPLVLIGLGIVFLLNNLGVVDWDIWQIVFRLWPILLIAAGLDLVIGRRSAVGTIVVLLVILGLVFAGVWLFSGALSGEPRTERVVQSAEGAERAEIEIGGSVGLLTVGALAEPGTLVRGTLDLAAGEELGREFRIEAGTAYFSLQSQGEWRIPGFHWWSEDREWELDLARAIPLRLTVNAGVGETRLELGELTATGLTFNGGVGRTWITLPGHGRYAAHVRAGVGEVEVILPAGLAARIAVSSGIGDIDVIGDFHVEDGVYFSPGFENAENRVELDVSGGIGRIVIKARE